MYAADGRAYDVQARTLLADLCFLDEREADQDSVDQVIDGYGKFGVVGPFTALFGSEGRYVEEVASVFAEQFHRLGYLAVDRTLSKDAWSELMAGVRERFNEHDVRRSEVDAMYGTPSLIVGQRVLCYAPDDGSAWVFFDCFAEAVRRYEPATGAYTFEPDHDPLVRCVRTPAKTFDAGLILTVYGKVLRWGPGWWLRHAERLSPEQKAVAAQLREVEAEDPSTALRARPAEPFG
ncbi:hypothetical protein Rhe02_59220 [Rhizocola hellebori]|uniref:Uncharacterized protein n=1 Tax=Rhizocola hellebori TaxID=1392758 RepID=A0A8J3VIR1_9ACTN|nr:hypothetical protein [Rhizocola hellebori]GIH07855.1 hypothetical protein Rhe02_59220 [Rhizocola hellebori]